ncbi:MAG: AAA+ type ATPase [Thermoanaerobacterales bacterium 50_218]|nr:MAG: AAA+ type ATPase [Thermoanaerobacterales bacterium 50_218]HAA90360.1 ATPase [Peptococcaceae bacterium]
MVKNLPAKFDVEYEKLQKGFEEAGYIIAEDALRTIFLALKLEKPLLVCGPSGVGKTELAKVLSKIFQARLIRLQCYEGLDESKAIYDWNYQKQVLQLQLSHTEELFSMKNILKRPLLQAITAKEPVVLLIDDIDEADRNFEALLLEILADFQVTIPEVGTIVAEEKPIVVITSSGKRELSEALRRRCVFLYLDYPGSVEEALIIRKKVPQVIDEINEEIALGVASMERCYSPEVIDWLRTLLFLNAGCYSEEYLGKMMDFLAKKRDNLMGLK